MLRLLRRPVSARQQVRRPFRITGACASSPFPSATTTPRRKSKVPARHQLLHTLSRIPKLMLSLWSSLGFRRTNGQTNFIWCELIDGWGAQSMRRANFKLLPPYRSSECVACTHCVSTISRASLSEKRKDDVAPYAQIALLEQRRQHFDGRSRIGRRFQDDDGWRAFVGIVSAAEMTNDRFLFPVLVERGRHADRDDVGTPLALKSRRA